MFSIIPKQPSVIREPYEQSIAKLVRDHDHMIMKAIVRYLGSTINIEFIMRSDTQIQDKLDLIQLYK